jgi:hypothetical protein
MLRYITCQAIALLFCLTNVAQSFQSSNLPIVVINTNGNTIVDDPKIMADMGIIYNGEGVRNQITDPFNHYNGKIGIEYRGQSSQMFPMKSYGLELWNNAGSGVNRSIFGLPAESDWILYAPYTDKTLMRNVLAYTISRELGNWASHTRYVELVVNGEYRGIYVFMEKIKRNVGRVNVMKLNSIDVAGDAVTGGYIFSIDKEADGWFSNYSAGTSRIQYSYIYPKLSSIVPAQQQYLARYVDSFETALNSPRFQDPLVGWRKFAQDSSFIDYFIVNEISKNVDGYRISTFLNKNRNSIDSKIKAGPVWDYDLGFRNANYCNGELTSGWAWQFNSVCPGDYFQVPFWWSVLNTDTAFQAKLLCRWKSLRTGTLSEAHLNHLIDSVATETNEARNRHFAKWNTLGQYIWPNPNPILTNYGEEISTLKSWLQQRLLWIDQHLNSIGGCANFPADVKATAILSIHPNPVANPAIIRVQSALQQTVTIEVISAVGQKLFQQQYLVSKGVNTYALPSQHWAHGYYWLKMTTASGEIITDKFLK